MSDTGGAQPHPDTTDDRREQRRARARRSLTIRLLDVELDRVSEREVDVIDASASAARVDAPGWDPQVGDLVHVASPTATVPLLCRVHQHRGFETVLTLVTPAAAPLGLARALGLAEQP